jgi:hypothetical protein
LITKKSAFSRDLSLDELIEITKTETRPDLPEGVTLIAKRLIGRAWSVHLNERLTFQEIVTSLENIQFKVTKGFGMLEVFSFVRKSESLFKQSKS